MSIAFFDFDGTISDKDSMVEFIKFAVGKYRYYYCLLKLSPILLLYSLRIISNNIAKEKLFSSYFKGWYVEEFEKLAEKYSELELNKIIKPSAIDKIKWHQEQGHKVVVVSASIGSWLKKWCELYQIELIATQLEFKNGKLTGRFATKNCYGIEKVNRIKAQFDLTKYEQIYAYGDSAGDKEMLAISTHPHYKLF